MESRKWTKTQNAVGVQNVALYILFQTNTVDLGEASFGHLIISPAGLKITICIGITVLIALKF